MPTTFTAAPHQAGMPPWAHGRRLTVPEGYTVELVGMTDWLRLADGRFPTPRVLAKALREANPGLAPK